MSDELKPCPFCGGQHLSTTSALNVHWITCIKCSISSAAPNHFGQDGLSVAWNTRPIEDELRKQLEEAKEREKKYIWALRTIRKTAKAQKTTACSYICAIIGDSGLPDDGSESK